MGLNQYIRGQKTMVKMSTEGKVLGILELFEKYLSNDLVDNYDDERMIEYD